MTKRVVTTIPGENGVDVRVYYDPDWTEYVCIPRVHCVPDRAASYHTDDKTDALGTARIMVNTYKPSASGLK